MQFARDISFITSFQTKKLCGVKPKLDLIKKNEDIPESDVVASSPDMSRLYVENTDHEMDIWLSVKRSDSGDADENWKPRNLTLVVTVFKQGCGSKDNYYRPCPNTQNCIR